MERRGRRLQECGKDHDHCENHQGKQERDSNKLDLRWQWIASIATRA